MQTVTFYTKNNIPDGLPYGYYFKSGLFAQYVTQEPYNHYSSQHWKIHINYPLFEKEEVKKDFLATILGFLRENDLNHKVVLYERNMMYRMNRAHPANTQNGKIITIYCRSEKECWFALNQLDQITRTKGYINYPLKHEQHFRNDRLFRNNPYIGYRYASSPRRPYYVIPYNQFGQEIEDLQEKYDGQKNRSLELIF